MSCEHERLALDKKKPFLDKDGRWWWPSVCLDCGAKGNVRNADPDTEKIEYTTRGNRDGIASRVNTRRPARSIPRPD